MRENTAVPAPASALHVSALVPTAVRTCDERVLKLIPPEGLVWDFGQDGDARRISISDHLTSRSK